jgi:hypothetical protein
LQAWANTTEPSSALCSLKTMPSGLPRSSCASALRRGEEWPLAQILAVELQEIERIQERRPRAGGTSQFVETRETVGADHHLLAAGKDVLAQGPRAAKEIEQLAIAEGLLDPGKYPDLSNRL